MGGSSIAALAAAAAAAVVVFVKDSSRLDCLHSLRYSNVMLVKS